MQRWFDQFNGFVSQLDLLCWEPIINGHSLSHWLLFLNKFDSHPLSIAGCHAPCELAAFPKSDHFLGIQLKILRLEYLLTTPDWLSGCTQIRLTRKGVTEQTLTTTSLVLASSASLLSVCLTILTLLDDDLSG